MAGITVAPRDLAETRQWLRGWIERRLGAGSRVSEFSNARRAAEWSSETLAFSVARPEAAVETLCE